MKTILPVLAICLLTGCASLRSAGISSFDAAPIADTKTGETTCCSIHWVSGKEYTGMTVHATKGADGTISIDVVESGVAAFKGQEIAADAFKSAVAEATKAALAAVLAPILPALAPAVGAALTAPGLGAAAVGAAGGIAVDKLITPAK